MLELIGLDLGQYRIERKINEGAMATIFKAYQPTLNRYVAIKVLPPAFVTQDTRFIKRFQREANLIARLDHPHIVPVYDFGIDRNYSYIVMRYVPGGFTLKRLLYQPLQLKQAVALIGQIAEALDYAHRQGIIHRDVKPGNVLLDESWLLLSDFGLAKLIEANTELTDQGTRLGTPLYMSPEQLQAKAVDHRSDIYALGVILYQMLTGAIPHQADNYWAIGLKRWQEPPHPPRALNPAIPESVEHIILRTLAAKPENRYDTATDMAIALQQALSNGAGQEQGVNAKSAVEIPLTRVNNSQKTLNKTQPRLTETVPSVRRPAFTRLSWANLVWLMAGITITAGGFIFGSNAFNRVTPQSSPTQTIPVMAINPTPSPTSTPTNTQVSPTIAPSLTPTPTPTSTPIPSTGTATTTATPTHISNVSTARPTFTITPILGPASPSGTLTLINPLSLDEPSYGPTNFEWEWIGSKFPEFGFEVRVWREGEFPAGVHNAIEDNQNGRIEAIGENRYHLNVNVHNATGIQGQRGEYWWTVAMVQISPTYADIGIQAEPAKLRFEPVGRGSKSSGNGDGGGFIN